MPRSEMEVTMSLVSFLATFIIVVLVKWAINRRRKLNLFKELGIPGPEPNFLTGNLFHLKAAKTQDEVFAKWFKMYGEVFGYFVGEVPYIVIKDLEMIKQVFVKDFSIFMNRPRPPLALNIYPTALVCVEGKRWKEIRSILTPAFTSGKIKLLTETVNRKVDVTVSLVANKAKNNEMFDIYPTVQGLTLDVIADCAFAMKTQCQMNDEDKFLLAAKSFFSSGSNVIVLTAIMFPFLSNVLVLANRFLTNTANTLFFLAEHLKSAISYRQSHRDIKRNDFLQLVLDSNQNESKNGMSEEDIVANAMTFLLAGFDTTATALTFTFYLLITHPEIQEKLYQEISEAEDCSYNTIQSLRYLDQVFNESLRCYPPVTGFTSRTCSQDHQVGSITVPKSARVIVPIWEIHHDPGLWPEPYKFDPERWSPENKPSINSMAFLPFGIGPRNCIGSRFALLEAKLTVFRLVKEFKFVPCEKSEIPITLRCPSVIIRPDKGVYARAIPRTSQQCTVQPDPATCTTIESSIMELSFDYFLDFLALDE